MSTKVSKTVKVLFPCVHGLAEGQFITINCFSVKELKSAIKIVTGVDEEIAGRVIGAARYNETDSRTGLGVMVLFSNPMFSGESYGLALAVADKLARFEPVDKWNGIYATGYVSADGCGRVDTVGCFSEKLDLMLEYAKQGSVFLYPAKNFVQSDRISEKLEQLKAQGIKCMAVACLEDLNDKLWQVSENQKDKKVRKWAVGGVQLGSGRKPSLLALVMLIAISCLLLVFVYKPHFTQISPKTFANKAKTVILDNPDNPDNPADLKNKEIQTNGTEIRDEQIQVSQKVAPPPVYVQNPVLESDTSDSTPY